MIKQQKNNKAPGPDAIPAELYKLESNIILTNMLEIYNNIATEATLPASWSDALISLIPKPDTDKEKIQNYRPISLLNSDYKIFIAIYATRLKRILNNIIHQDQNGFLPQRQIKNNLRTIINTIEYYEEHPGRQMALVFLDAQKAFDNVNWKFIKLQLEQMKFGPKFTKLINSIYSNQTARIIFNGEQTDKFKIQRGVRQGCPLSPLLFILTLETLLIKIREDEEIKGLKIRNEYYKIQAFADDLVFTIEDPLETIPKLINVIENFGEVAGLKINRNKTQIITKNLSKRQKDLLEENTNMKVVKKVKYLGIWITAKSTTLKDDNYTKLLIQIKKELEMWKNLQLSLLGRIATIKMNVLPKLLYWFQVIPISPGKQFFSELTKITIKYIWQGKKSRIKQSSLQDVKERGGLGLPNWKIYYQAAALAWIKEWIMLRNKRILTLEGYDLLLGWHAYIWYDKYKIHSYFKKHIIRNSLLQTWLEIKKDHYQTVPDWISPIDLVYHPNLIHFERIIKYRDLLDAQLNLRTKEELNERGVTIDWWTYTQIYNIFYKDKRDHHFRKCQNNFDKIFMSNEGKLIGRLYKFLIRYKTEGEIVKDNMISWARNIGHSIDLDKWERIWTYNWQITKAVTFKENQLKMFYRWHLSPQRLSKIYPGSSPRCWKCRKENGTFYHQWWTCSESKKYWAKIARWLKEITNNEIEKTPDLFLLGIFNKNYKKDIRYLTIYILTAARIIFAQYWKSEDLPKEEEIIKKFIDCAEMDMMTRRLQGQEDSEYYKIWNKLYKWLEKRNMEGIKL